VIGVDDNNPERLCLMPRLPDKWNQISVSDYPVLTKVAGKQILFRIDYQLKREKAGLRFDATGSNPLPMTEIRMGPFSMKARPKTLVMNGVRANAKPYRSGDSWWVKVPVPIGARKISVRCFEN
ncbi:MAG: hypothetical protein WCL39_05300, partial [Armatimonadota bacterium]